MAKVQQKSEKITAFGGIFFVLDKFDSILSSVIDSHLGLRSTLIGYQYSEIIRAIFNLTWGQAPCEVHHIQRAWYGVLWLIQITLPYQKIRQGYLAIMAG